MRIGISTTVIQRGKTGIAQYLFALLRAFLTRNSNHEFVLFALEEDVPLFAFAKDSVEIVPIPENHRPPVKNIVWHHTILPSLVHKHQVDILHVPSYRRLLWRKPVPLVATIHDLAPFHVTGKYDWKRMFYGKVIVKRIAARQDAIIAISENTARDIVHFFGLPRERMTVIHNGLDHDRFNAGDANRARAFVSEKYGITAPFFLYMARLEHPAKNHVGLIQAFESFKVKTKSNWKLVFGGSDWHGAEAIHNAIRRSSFSTDIRSLGFVADAALPDLYRAACVFVYPSLYEGFGMPPTEAMACGCPVISSTRGALGEVVGDAAAIVEPESIESMADQLEAVATDPARREQLRVAGLARAREFNWNIAAEKTLKVYENAARTIRRVRVSKPALVETV